MQNPPSNKRTHEQSIKEEYKGEHLGQHQFQANQANGSEQYENDNPNHVIDKASTIWWCIDCDKKYKSYPAFYTHNKIKHNGNPPSKYRIPRALDQISKDRGRPRADNNPKMKFTTEDKAQHNLEDNLFDFLGNLGSKESSNTIIREYLKKPLDASDVLDKIKNILIQRKNIYQFYSILEFEFSTSYLAETSDYYYYYCSDSNSLVYEQEEEGEENLNSVDEGKLNYFIHKIIRKLNQVLKDHENDEFIDPLDIDPEAQDDISLYNIKGWLGKELTESALKEVLMICIEYFSYFTVFLDQKGSLQSKQIESRDAATSQIRQIYETNQYQFNLLKKFDDAKKLVEFFHQWYCNYEKMISSNVQQPPMQQGPPPPQQYPQQQIRIPQQIPQPHHMQYQQIQMMQPMQPNLQNTLRLVMDPNQMLNNQ